MQMPAPHQRLSYTRISRTTYQITQICMRALATFEPSINHSDILIRSLMCSRRNATWIMTCKPSSWPLFNVQWSFNTTNS